MKAIRIFGRSIRDAFKSITRNFSLSMASILCDMITLIIVSVAIIIAVNVNNATRSIEKEMNIVVYINKNASEEDRITYFHAFFTALGKLVYNREKLNRFVMNKKFYQRNDVSISFVAKTGFTDDAEEFFTLIKVDEKDREVPKVSFE